MSGIIRRTLAQLAASGGVLTLVGGLGALVLGASQVTALTSAHRAPHAFLPGILGLFLLQIWAWFTTRHQLEGRGLVRRSDSVEPPIAVIIASVLMAMALLNHLALRAGASMQTLWVTIAIGWALLLGDLVVRLLPAKGRPRWRGQTLSAALAGATLGFTVLWTIAIAVYNPFLAWDHGTLTVEDADGEAPAGPGDACTLRVAPMPVDPWFDERKCHLRVRCDGDALVPGFWQGAFECVVDERDGGIHGITGGDDDWDDGDPAWHFEQHRLVLRDEHWRIEGPVEF